MSEVTLAQVAVWDRPPGSSRSEFRQATVDDLIEVLESMGATVEDVNHKWVGDEGREVKVARPIIRPTGRYLIFRIEEPA